MVTLCLQQKRIPGALPLTPCLAPLKEPLPSDLLFHFMGVVGNLRGTKVEVTYKMPCRALSPFLHQKFSFPNATHQIQLRCLYLKRRRFLGFTRCTSLLNELFCECGHYNGFLVHSLFKLKHRRELNCSILGREFQYRE